MNKLSTQVKRFLSTQNLAGPTKKIREAVCSWINDYNFVNKEKDAI